MNEKEFALELINEAQKSRAISGMAFTTVDISEFKEGKHDIEIFKEIIADMGYKLIPIEESHLRNLPIKNKYVLIGR